MEVVTYSTNDLEEVQFLIPVGIAFGRPRASGWAKLAKMFLLQNPSCAACGTTKFLVPHHIIPFWKDKTKELLWENLITMCESPTMSCHFYLAHRKLWQSWNENIVEEAAAMLEKIRNRP